ncbi:MAG: M48 family metallopeptidase [Firmicutes bacterium]|nr:M48 family metallopeptidase [Bacillota bacterium]
MFDNVDIVYEKRKSMVITVDNKGVVTLKAPIGTKAELVNAFLKSKQKWIKDKVKKSEAVAGRFSHILDLSNVLYLGVEYPVAIVGDKPTKIKDSQFVIALKHADKESRKKQIASYLKRQAKKYIEQRCDYIANHMGMRYDSLKIIDSRSRWGVCKIKNTSPTTSASRLSSVARQQASKGQPLKEIGLNWRLIMLPPLIIDYVVIHELAHFKHMDHSKEFWMFVEQFMPNFREVRKALKEVNVLNTMFRK